MGDVGGGVNEIAVGDVGIETEEEGVITESIEEEDDDDRDTDNEGADEEEEAVMVTSTLGDRPNIHLVYSQRVSREERRERSGCGRE